MEKVNCVADRVDLFGLIYWLQLAYSFWPHVQVQASATTSVDLAFSRAAESEDHRRQASSMAAVFLVWMTGFAAVILYVFEAPMFRLELSGAEWFLAVIPV